MYVIQLRAERTRTRKSMTSQRKANQAKERPNASVVMTTTKKMKQRRKRRKSRLVRVLLCATESNLCVNV